MKKILAILLAVVLVLSFVGCSNFGKTKGSDKIKKSDIVGLWEWTSGNAFIAYQAFAFYEDGTGEGLTRLAAQYSSSTSDSPKKITWKIVDDGVVFVYEGETFEHKLVISSDKKQLVNEGNNDQVFEKS